MFIVAANTVKLIALLLIQIYHSELQIHTFVNMLSCIAKTLKGVHKEKQRRKRKERRADTKWKYRAAQYIWNRMGER